uniref:SH3 domain-containing protein n=1 Tax=Eptatretus burgeri TaxID=7764 RepID=A0A8C4QQH3_EPTBU
MLLFVMYSSGMPTCFSGSPWGWQSCIDARQKAIANFCRAVASLPRARRLVCVSNLFRPRPEELEYFSFAILFCLYLGFLEISAPILLPTYRARASYSRKNKMELSFQQGDLLEVVSKSSSGWWLCLLPPQRGWAPASLLELVDTDSDMGLEKPDLEGLLYEVTQDYVRSEADELSLSRGDQVRVIYRPPDGWWVVRRILMTHLNVQSSQALHKRGQRLTVSLLFVSSPNADKSFGRGCLQPMLISVKLLIH